jgi:hypothetical protein
MPTDNAVRVGTVRVTMPTTWTRRRHNHHNDKSEEEHGGENQHYAEYRNS